MSDNIVKLADEALENVSGGMTRNLKAAYACINGDYGNGEARFAALRKAGFDPNVVQGLVNDLLKYEKVAKDGERDYWMTAQEALEYGMVDEILCKRK